MFLRKEVRTIHLIDGENLAGGPSRMPCRPDLGNQYRMAAKPADDDLVVVGSDITNMFFGAAWFPGARLVTGRGQSGADFALMRSNTVGWLADRVGTVVVASGDGDFALFARACRVAGIRVVVVARRSSVSWALLRSADTFVPFPEWGDNEMAMASAAGSGASSVLTDRTGATDDQAAA